MAIRVERIRSDVEAIARCTATPEAGASRPTFSPPWGEARAYVLAQAEAADCEIRSDAAGNVRVRPASLGWDAPAWLVGSHLDTVPHGGDYDGVAGVVAGLELLRSAAEDGVHGLAVELIVFAEEEGPTFGLGMLGSRALVGELTVDQLGKLRNAEGQSYLEAGAPYGVDAARLDAERLDPSRYLGFIELHIEQGPGMWRRDQRLAVVTAIAGRRQYRVTVTGEANHAGATSMDDRRDALAGAAEVVVGLEELARSLGPGTVLTVGRLDSHPNAVNVIPQQVTFTIDFRSPDDATLEKGHAEIVALVDAVTQRRRLTGEVTQAEVIAATPMSSVVADGLRRAAALAGQSEPATAVSGALHDSAVIAKRLPTAMLFVPSRDGVSHNSAEFSRVEDIAGGAAVMEVLVRRPTLAQLNALGRSDFVAVDR